MSMDTTKIEYQPNILVISGGGPKGISFVGVLTLLQEMTTFDIKKLKILSGSSIGGVICTAICLGYELGEMKKWFLSTDFSSLCPALYDENHTSKILPLLYKHFSLSNGSEIKLILEKTFMYKSVDTNITFKELYDKTNKLLILSGSNVKRSKVEYFSHIKTPHMKVFDALLITTRIPYVFPYISYNHQMYIDGHVFDPFPIKGCGRDKIKENKGKILGITSVMTNEEKEINNIKQFTFSLIEGLSYQYMKKSTEKYKKSIVSVKLNTGFFNLKITPDELNIMFEVGKTEALNFIKKKLHHNT